MGPTILFDDSKARVQQATDIVRLVGEHVALRPRGKEFIGLCPFHDDKNPSMYVSPVKQIYKCFSCGAGGDVFSFMMSYHKMTFPEALKNLAEKAGIALPERTRGFSGEGQDEGPTDRQRLLEANANAASFFQTLYRHTEHGAQARAYVAKRGISPEMVEAFQIGYAPDRWDGLVRMAADKGWSLQNLNMAGLLSARQKNSGFNDEAGGQSAGGNFGGGGYYDRFRHRLMFPICDAIGRVIAMGGRKMREEDEPKYLNSPESAIFNKSATLYGLHLAKKAIIDQHYAVITEGYTDVIACHQHGVKNVVATLGTALTAQHVAELRRYCEKVILIYDGDEAGIKASDRALEVFLKEGLDVAIAVLPDELDPADLFELPDGRAKWEVSMTGAKDALEYQFNRVRMTIDGAQTVTGRQKVIEDYLRKLASIGLAAKGSLGSGPTGMVRKALVLQRLSGLLGMPAETISELLIRSAPLPLPKVLISEPSANNSEAVTNPQNVAPQEGATIAAPESEASIKALRVAERQVIGALLHHPELFTQVLVDGRSLEEALSPQELPTEPGRQLYGLIYEKLANGQLFTLVELLGDLAQQNLAGLANLATAAQAEAESVWQDNVEGLQTLIIGSVRAIQGHHRHRDYQRLRLELNQGMQPESTSPSVSDNSTAATSAERLRLLAEHLATPSMRRMPKVRT